MRKCKKWTGPNRTSRYARAAPAQAYYQIKWNVALLSGQSGFQISVFLHSFGLQTLPTYLQLILLGSLYII